MKKLQLVAIMSIVACTLFICSKVSAQEIYTKKGGDLTGSDIDTNQGHRLISSSPYKDRKNQVGRQIHTIANSNVPQAVFHKCTLVP